MNIFKIGPISGIFNQFLSSKETINGKHSYVENNYLDINSWFWSEQLKSDKIQECLNILSNRIDEFPIKVQWALRNPHKFMDCFHKSKESIKTLSPDPQNFYYKIEILQLACTLIYYAETAPFYLDVSIGFRRGNDSSRELRENCLLPHSNPYLNFIQQKIIPEVKKHSPTFIWMFGQPNIATFAIASLLKQIFPKLQVGVTYHSSEYYSLNKITPLLEHNHDFFKIFDVVVLYDDSQTMMLLEDALHTGSDFSTIPNLIYSPDAGHSIIKTSNIIQNSSLDYSFDSNNINHPLNIKLFPQNSCWWNKCNFCGINKKYYTSHKEWNIDYAISLIGTLIKKGFKYFWIIDEAIPVDTLSMIAQKILDNKWDISWHVRCRIEEKLTDAELCMKLKEAGLKSILLGFECASSRILQMMNKTAFPDTYLDVSERIVKQFNNRNISVHFPAIIGFPTETSIERAQTLTFLNYLRQTYSRFSYNINILELDISSQMYSKFEEYNISSIHYPCPPFSFIGNSVSWEMRNTNELKKIQQEEMHNLFKWFPRQSFIEIDMFYRLMEHTRIPFWHDYLYEKESENYINVDTDYVKCTDNLCLFYSNESDVIIFNEDRMDYVQGGVFLNTIFELNDWCSCKKLIHEFPLEFHEPATNLIQELVNHKILKVRR